MFYTQSLSRHQLMHCCSWTDFTHRSCCYSAPAIWNWSHGCAIGRTPDLQFTGHGFKSWLGTITYWPWTCYLHLCASVTKQYNLVPAK